MCKNGITDSAEYVRKSLGIIRSKFPNFRILNVVISLECLIPKITPQHDAIQENVAGILEVGKNQVGLMYTTGEGLSEYGKGKGIKCLVEVLVYV
jgi:2-C-methyl-D-erythritol 2,4-cyclodiphosphate synthase